MKNLILALPLMLMLSVPAVAQFEPPADDPDFMQEEGMVTYRAGRYNDAIAIWTEKAEQGDANAAYQLAVVHTDGQVVDRDFGKAVYFLKIGAEGGDPRAQFDLGSFYDGGLGIQRSVRKAFDWYLAAARQGHDAAMFNTAMMYHDGAGTDRDLVEAYRWLDLAGRFGISDLGDVTLLTIEDQMSADEIRRARSLVEDTLRELQ